MASSSADSSASTLTRRFNDHQFKHASQNTDVDVAETHERAESKKKKHKKKHKKKRKESDHGKARTASDEETQDSQSTGARWTGLEDPASDRKESKNSFQNFRAGGRFSKLFPGLGMKLATKPDKPFRREDVTKGVRFNRTKPKDGTNAGTGTDDEHTVAQLTALEDGSGSRAKPRGENIEGAKGPRRAKSGKKARTEFDQDVSLDEDEMEALRTADNAATNYGTSLPPPPADGKLMEANRGNSILARFSILKLAGFGAGASTDRMSARSIEYHQEERLQAFEPARESVRPQKRTVPGMKPGKDGNGVVIAVADNSVNGISDPDFYKRMFGTGPQKGGGGKVKKNEDGEEGVHKECCHFNCYLWTLIILCVLLVLGASVGSPLYVYRDKVFAGSRDEGDKSWHPTTAPVPTLPPAPTHRPTEVPTEQPTPFPTDQPTPKPSPEPTAVPTPVPTDEPTPLPTPLPPTTPFPTMFPTTPSPTAYPSAYPTEFPSVTPTTFPTDFPSVSPTNYPTQFPATTML